MALVVFQKLSIIPIVINITANLQGTSGPNEEVKIKKKYKELNYFVSKYIIRGFQLYDIVAYSYETTTSVDRFQTQTTVVDSSCELSIQFKCNCDFRSLNNQNCKNLVL